MPQVNASKLITKLQKIEYTIRATLRDELFNVAKQINENIYTGAAMAYNPSWASILDWKGQPYFKLHRGLLDIIKEAGVSLTGDLGDNATMINVGIGHIPTLDSLTMSEGGVGKSAGRGFPYWRLFEYGIEKTRSKGSQTYTFFSPMRTTSGGTKIVSKKYGRRGDGYSVEGKPGADPKGRKMDPFGRSDFFGNQKKAGTKGVYPVFMYSGEMKAYRDRIKPYLAGELRLALRRFKE